MHLLATRPGGYAEGEGVVDLGQSPAEVVLLSAADTQLALLADALDAQPAEAPSVRLASLLQLSSHASVDLYAEQVLQHARLVVVALIGGTGYWRYGVEQLVERARDGRLELVLVSHDDAPDPELEQLGSAAPADSRRIWRYLREGSPENARALLAFLAWRYFGRGSEPPPPRVLPRAAVYHPAQPVAELGRWREDWAAGAPVVGLLFYRAHLQAGNLAAFDALIAELVRSGLAPLPIALASLKDPECYAFAVQQLAEAGAELVLNTTGFALASGAGTAAEGSAEPSADALSIGCGRPVLQLILSGGDAQDWREGTRGLSPRDLAMNVVLPELDGRVITRAVSFKDRVRRSARAELDVTAYRLEPERAAFAAQLASRWVGLARTPAAQRRVALVLANYPTRDGRLANGVGLDTPESTVRALHALGRAGYRCDGPPADGQALMEQLQGQVTNAPEWIEMRPAHQSLRADAYQSFLETLPKTLVSALHERWGPPPRDPMWREGRLMVSGVRYGNVFVGVQPARGYQLDVSASYHDPDLIPPHGYLAFYAWLRCVFGVHAIVHFGKHGNLEWLPGKSTALSAECWPDAALGPLPHLYPFIVNDPGEGTQAKRRAQAVILDHLMPPLTRAESYGALRELEGLVDEYYQAVSLDPPRAETLRRDILRAARAAALDRELGAQGDADDDRFLVSLDAYLCELKEAQIRGGLHVFGSAPEGEARLDTLVALSRIGTGDGLGANRSLLRALSDALLGPGFDPLDADFAAPWSGPRPDVLAKLADEPWRSAGDTRERLELCARAVLCGAVPAPAACGDVVERILGRVAPALDASGERERAGLLTGLDGRFVEPGPSGAPSRGRLDVLPTGRNFYSVDVRAIPTRAAARLAERAAAKLVERYVQDHGEWPRCIGLSVWGTATMRTGGDDLAQALALLGVRPVWDPDSGRVTGSEIVPAALLGRPRVDVVLRISGFFRDAFPESIALFDAAVRAVAELDEDAAQNPIAARVRSECAALSARGLSPGEAARRARWRVFGSKPGAYGAGLLGVIDQGAWSERADLADVYLRWGGYAYGADAEGVEAPEQLRAQLAGVEAVLHNQDNREHDLLDSDDYFQFQGGMAAAVEQARGAPAAIYHGDHANPEAPRVRSLREELSRVIRSRVVNPKWLAAMRRHGYKGAAEMAASVDYLFGYDAATGIVEDYQYALVCDALVLDEANRAFLAAHNPSALGEMAERLLEAARRGMWREPEARREALESILVAAEEDALTSEDRE